MKSAPSELGYVKTVAVHLTADIKTYRSSRHSSMDGTEKRQTTKWTLGSPA
jgi:hypothetical protein